MNNKHNAGLRSTFNTKPEPTKQSSIRDIQDFEIDRIGLDKNSPRSALYDGVLIEMFNSLYLRL